jgi:hypothetical protein
VSKNIGLTNLLSCSDNHLLDIVGLPAGTHGFDAANQTVFIPIHPDPGTPGSYVSDGTYRLGAHVIAFDGGASFDAASGTFTVTSLDVPIGFTTTLETGHRVSGTVIFTGQALVPVIPTPPAPTPPAPAPPAPPAPTPPAPAPPASSTPGYSAPSTNTSVPSTLDSEPTPAASPAPPDTADDELETVQEAPVPLAPEPDGTRSWALLNLLFVLAALVMAVYSLAKHLTSARSGARPAPQGSGQKANPVWLVLELAAIASGVVVFIVTEDFAGRMIFVDVFTVVQALIVAVAVALHLLAFKRSAADAPVKMA